MSINIPNTFNSYGSVVGATGVKKSGAGFTPARSAAGIYALTLDAAVDAAQCVCLATVRGAFVGFCHVEQTSDTVKTVNVVDAAGAALDADFDFAVLNCPAGV